MRETKVIYSEYRKYKCGRWKWIKRLDAVTASFRDKTFQKDGLKSEKNSTILAASSGSPPPPITVQLRCDVIDQWLGVRRDRRRVVDIPHVLGDCDRAIQMGEGGGVLIKL